MGKRDRTPSPLWAAVDVDLFSDPKIAELTAAERLAYISAILWTTKHLTDGSIGKAALTIAGVSTRQAARFVAVGLWQRTDDGYTITSWHKWQKPRDEWLKLHEHRRYAGELAACQRWHEEWCRCLEGEIPIRKRT